ncbi:hypothetical protein GCM10010430_73270 [Kitasatospora cystarginea]|uniref:Uncharacterized protein n=1 Tax=Kitasatospora cystarginea TaxID=58350 RepID=A0ABP5RUZ4_9ACTN
MTVLAFTRTMGNRLLNALVPQQTASAGCGPDYTWCNKYLDDTNICLQTCYYNGHCQAFCSP